MATYIETRMTYWAKSNGNSPGYSSENPDTRGKLAIYYELNSAKTAYNLTVKYFIDTFDYQANSTTNASLTCKINGASIGKITKTLMHTAGNGKQQQHSLGTKTTSVPLNADGSCSFTFYCLLEPLNSGGGSNRTFQVTHTLPTVNLSSTVSNDTSGSSYKDFGTSVAFSISRPSSNPTHTLKYWVNGTEYTIGSGIETYTTYTFPTSLINSFPNNAYISIPVTCYSSNGTTSSTTVYLKVPDNYVPSCSLAISDVGDVPSSWGIWLKSKSKISGSITASGSAGSWISSYNSSANGSNYTSSSFTTDYLKNSGSQTITSTVADSRGRQKSDSKTISVVDYWTPTLSSFSVVRCNAEGVEENEGTYGKVKCNYSIAPCSNKNTKSLIVKYGDVSKTFTLSAYSGTVEATSSELFSGLSTASNHAFEFYLIDYFNPNGIKYGFTMPPSFTTISYLNGGKGVSIGQVATEEGFNVHMDAKFHKNVILENGNVLDFNGTNNQIKFGYDNSTWLPKGLTDMGAKKIFCAMSKENPTDEGEFNIAYKDTKCYPYTDGAFYQGLEGNRCLDTSCIVKLSDNQGSATSWYDAKLGIDVSGYDFLIIVSSHQSIIVPANFDIYLTWNGWYSPVSKDVVTQRHIYREDNDIHWGLCYYRGINGYTGADSANDIDYPKQVYGIKVT